MCEFQWQKVKMAMALHTKNAHYRIAEIQRQHWNAVAKANALGSDFEAVIQKIVSVTPAVIETVGAGLPSEFPVAVSERIFDGLFDQVRRLNAGRSDF